MADSIVVDTSRLRGRRGSRNRPKGRAVDAQAAADIAALLGDAPRRRDLLIEFLHRIQDRYGHLSAAHLVALASEMRLAMTEVYEVATFYHHFDVVKEGEEAPPTLTVRVCETLSCQMAGADALRHELAGLRERGVRVIGAPCVGRCEHAPVAVVGRNPVDGATADKIADAIDGGRVEAQVEPYLDLAAYREGGGYQVLRDCVEGRRDAEAVIAEMESSALRGLGGAGFPTGRKWKIVRAEPAPRLMAVNIDEGEPGTFKDRFYLERDPHRFLEGMLIAAWAVGIDEIYVYLRDEYAACRALLADELAALERDPPCPLPRIHLRRGAGAYICGEESAMIESIEGKRGMPRLRPPYVAQVGLFGRPTLEHNMETLYWVREILEKGAAWFAGQGRHGRKGLRSFSVSGRVAKPGVHLAPAGITVRELIAEYCGGMQDGHEFYGYLPGGASGGILPASLGDIPLDFDTLQPHGCFIGSAAVIILSQHDRARDAALNLMRFFADESCGQCTPCRVGTEKAVMLMREPRWDQPLLQELSQAMTDASICGLGQAAPNPIACVVKYFPQELDRMNAPLERGLEQELVAFKLNGAEVTAFPGETLIQVADRLGVAIPRLCYKPGMRADGNCRSCMVEIKGERVLAPSCCRSPVAGMEVQSDSARAVHAQKMIVELLVSDMPDKVYKKDSELEYWRQALGVGKPRFTRREQPAADISHPAMAVNLDACIQCTRCVRACREEQVNDVIGYAYRGGHSSIVFDLHDPMGDSTCVACGECVQACPTGALAPANEAYLAPVDKTVSSLCPYCGVGCQLTYHVHENAIVRVEGRDGPANHERLCVKGRFGFDYVGHPHRLTTPLIRREGMPKSADFTVDPANPLSVFREATWDEAMTLASDSLRRIRDTRGPNALAGFGSAKGSNEEAYLFQKLVRTGFGTNNVDHCTRLCHASSVAALLEGIGSGAVSNPVMDVMQADVVLLIGANPVVNHPVAATWIKNATKRGTRLILADPRRSELARHATHYLQFKSDTDVALLNAMMHTIIEEGLVAERFVADRTSGFAEIRDNVAPFSPEAMAPICGIDAGTIRTVARMFATSRAAMILWGMGISQHVHGTDNARCLIALTMLTGQVGRPGTGLHPLRGQNNVQGASDAGLIPMMYPDYRRVDNASAQGKFEALWGTALDQKPGLTVVEIMNAVHAGQIRGMYIMGENPAMSDPDVQHARQALAELEMLIVQDIFLTETAYLADVILPASAFPEKTGTFTNTDRLVQLGRQALKPPGDARQDLAIIVDMGRRLGLDWRYEHPRDVFAEMRLAMPSIAGITWERLERESAVTYPCEREGDPGERVVFTESFPTASGRAKLVPAALIPGDEQPDTEYPFILITGRQLEHWHTGSMTRRTEVLDAIEPAPVASFNPADLVALGVAPGGALTVASRRGSVSLYARADSGTPRGTAFIPFCYYEAAANLLTNPVLDPFGKIPEFKFCAVRVTAGGSPSVEFGYGDGAVDGAAGVSQHARQQTNS